MERRDLFAEGVASGDPDSTSVLLWTRASVAGPAPTVNLKVEVAEDAAFARLERGVIEGDLGLSG